MKKIYFISAIVIVCAISVDTYLIKEQRRTQETPLVDLKTIETGRQADIFRDHLVIKENIRTSIVKNSLDSDKSQCSKPPLVTEKVITNFSGHVLEYPCTVRSHGNIRTDFDEQGNATSEYQLYLYVTLNDDGSVWKLRHDELSGDKISFRVILRSNGRDIIKPPRIKRMNQMTKAYDGEINGLTIYRDQFRYVGFLESEKDASGNPPAISCWASSKRAVEGVFSPLENPSYSGRRCSAGWALTKNIYLYMPPSAMKSKDAYHFKDIYRAIHPGVRDSIVSIFFTGFNFSQEYPAVTLIPTQQQPTTA